MGVLKNIIASSEDFFREAQEFARRFSANVSGCTVPKEMESGLTIYGEAIAAEYAWLKSYQQVKEAETALNTTVQELVTTVSAVAPPEDTVLYEAQLAEMKALLASPIAKLHRARVELMNIERKRDQARQSLANLPTGAPLPDVQSVESLWETVLKKGRETDTERGPQNTAPTNTEANGSSDRATTQ